MELVSISRDDIHELSAICMLSLPYDRLAPEDLRHGIFNDPGCEERWNLAAKESGRVVGFVVGALRQSDKEGKLGLVKIFAVHPEAQRAGAATALFDRLEGALKGAGATEVIVGARGPLYFFGGLDPRYTEAYLFLTKRGYAKTADTFYLSVDLHQPLPDYTQLIAQRAAEGITFHRPAMAEKREVQEWILRAFGEGWRYETGLAFREEKVTVWIARAGGKVCGFAASNATGRDYFGPTGVADDQRGKGLGRVLLVKCLEDMQADGRPIAWIPTGLGRISYYYNGARARVGRVFWRMGKALK
ncbi:MAG: GNAT family N-acetyltransferase [Planctomycetota bacterium]